MYFEKAKEIYSEDNIYTYCNHVKVGGIFTLVDTTLFTDIQSTFTFISANYGGVLSLKNSSAVANFSTFTSNIAHSGGVVFLQHNSSFTTYKTNLKFNIAYH